MSRDLELEEFLKKYMDPPARARKRAAEIMLSGLPSFLSPRLDLSRSGRRRWVTRLDTGTDLRRFTSQYPVL